METIVNKSGTLWILDILFCKYFLSACESEVLIVTEDYSFQHKTSQNFERIAYEKKAALCIVHTYHCTTVYITLYSKISLNI